MKLKLVVVDLETPAWLKKTFGVCAPIVAVATTGIVLATPKNFMDGQQLSAADLNAMNTITVNGVKYSVGATHYCGTSPQTTTGKFVYATGTKTGFAAAKAMCEAGCGSPTAHMCSAEEISRSKQLGDAVALGWYSNQLYANTTNLAGNVTINDCFDWTSEATSTAGPASDGSGIIPNSCSAPTYVDCCD